MKKELWRYTELPYLIDFLSSGQLALPNPSTWDDRNDSYYIEQYLQVTNYNSAYALCMAEVRETYHHWKVYSPSPSGVCIVFREEAFLEDAIRTSGLRAEKVEYRTIEHMKSNKCRSDQLPFLKRTVFRDEQELRLFLPSKQEQKPIFPIPISIASVDRIILSPWLPESVVEHVKSLLRKLDGCGQLTVHRSTLIDNVDWKNFANKSKA